MRQILFGEPRPRQTFDNESGAWSFWPLTLFRPGDGFWCPRKLWRCITSWRLKLSPQTWRLFLKIFWEHFDTCITWSPTLTLPWQPVFQFLHFSVLINIISMVYGVIRFFSLILATIYQIRYNLAYIILKFREVFILSCRTSRWQTTIAMKTTLLCISIDVYYFQFFNILLLGIYVWQSNNFDF